MKKVGGIAHVLAVMRDKGIKLWTDQGRLLYQAPPGSITSDERQVLQRRRQEIVAFLNKQTTPTHSNLPSQARLLWERAMPLTPSQRWLWRVMGKPTKRTMILLRLTGRWQIPRLQAAFLTMLRRHDALRMRVSLRDGVPRLQILEGEQRQFKIVQLDQLPRERRESAAKHFALSFREEELAVPGASEFEVRVIVMGAEDNVLLISWNHLFFDAVSLNIFWNELWNLYLHPADPQLSYPRPVQFSEFVLRQEEVISEWRATGAQFWKDLLCGAKVPRLGLGESPCGATPSASEIDLQFDFEFMERVRTTAQQLRTSVGMLLLTTLLVAIEQSCGEEEVVLCCATTSRRSRDLQSTIGFISSVIFLRVRVARNDQFAEVLRNVTDQYINGMRHDLSGWLLDQPPFTDLQRCILFNYFSREMIMNGAERFNSCRREGISAGLNVQRLNWFARDEEEWIRFLGERELYFWIYESQGKATARAEFRSDRVPRHSVHRFLGSFEISLASILANPNVRIGELAAIT